MRTLSILIGFLLFGVVSSANSSPTLKVGVIQSEPFCMYHHDQWTGLAIDLFEASVPNGVEYEYIEFKGTYDDAIESVESGELDLLVADVTVTGERLDKVEFSQPFYVTNTTFAKKFESRGMLSALLTWGFMKSILMFLLFIFISGAIMWLAERDTNEAFQHGALGIFTGAYFVSATMTTVGYGDIAAKSQLGRVLAFILMWVSLIITAILIGNISSAITVSKLTSDVENLSDLNKMKVGTLQGTSSAGFLYDNDIKYINYNSTEEALTAINDDELDVFVYGEPILQYYTSQDKYSDIELGPMKFNEQTYGFVLPSELGLTSSINSEMMKVIRGSGWEAMCDKYKLQ